MMMEDIVSTIAILTQERNEARTESEIRRLEHIATCKRVDELEADNAKLRAEAIDRNLECADVILKLRARLALAEAVCQAAPLVLDAVCSADHYTGRGCDEADEMETKFRETLAAWREGKAT